MPQFSFNLTTFMSRLALITTMLSILAIFPASAWADSLILHATVPAKPTDFQLELQPSLPPPVGSNQDILYTINYGWLPNYPTDIMVIQAQWSLGTYLGNPIDVVTLISGSATDAMGQFSPQIDVANRTITWNITPVTPGADKQVSFILHTGALGTGDTIIPFTVSTRIIGPGIALPWQTTDQSYLATYVQPTPTPTATRPFTPGTLTGPTPVPSPSGTPTPTGSPSISVTPKPVTGSVKPTPSRFPGVSRIPLVGPTLQQTLDHIDRLAHQNGAVVAIPALVVATIPWLLAILPGLAALVSNLSLWQLLSLVGILFWRQRRHPWGVVYDSKTKLPLDPVLLTLTDTNGKTYQTVSDLYGRYQFVVEPGEYIIKAQKSNYTFPSTQFENSQRDEIYEDLYFGQTITVTDNGTVSLNIPMDPQQTDWNQVQKQHASIARQLLMEKAGRYVYLAGIVWSMIMALLAPSLFNIVILATYIVLTIFMLAYRHRHPWGVIYDHDHHPVSGAVVSLADINNPQITRPPVVTTAAGRYAFLVDQGKYQLSVLIRNPFGSVWPVTSSPPIQQTKHQGHIAKDITLP